MSRPTDPPATPPTPQCRAGVDEVLKHLTENEPRRVLVYNPGALVPRRLSRGETRRLLQDMRDRHRPVIVTSLVQGSDFVVRTMEYMGDPTDPSSPAPPVPPDPDPTGF